jgi:formate dehydrogenase maturation protein FdhE
MQTNLQGLWEKAEKKHKDELLRVQARQNGGLLATKSDVQLESLEQMCREEKAARRRRSMEAELSRRVADNKAQVEEQARGQMRAAVAQREEELRAAAEEERICPICYEAPRNHSFQCGHTACGKCAIQLANCHMCRIPITSRVRLFST